MSEVKKFVEYWKKHSDIPVLEEFRPQRHEYDNTETDLKYRDWLKSKHYSDFRGDLAILCEKFGVVIEFDGSGGSFSHHGSGAERDRQKSNQFLRQGFITIRFSIQTLKNNPSYVFDEIYNILEIWFPEVLNA